MAQRSRIYRNALRRSGGDPDSGGDNPPGTSDALQADWTGTRYYAIDYDGGSDSNQGWSDTSLAAAGAVAWKTIEHCLSEIPRVGNNRDIVIGIKPRAGGATYLKQDGVTADSFDWWPFSGYASVLVRASDTWASTAADQIKCGAIQALAGAGAGGAWTVTGGVSTLGLDVVGGLTAEPALLGKRVRFTGNVTPALANVCAAIQANTATFIGFLTALGTAPAVGDTFYIEEPGVVIDDCLLRGNSPINIAGISCTGSLTGYDNVYLRVSFCEGAGIGFQNSEEVLTFPSYVAEGGFTRTTGVGVRTDGRIDCDDVINLRVQSSYAFGNHTTVVSCGSYFLTGYFNELQVNNSGGAAIGSNFWCQIGADASGAAGLQTRLTGTNVFTGSNARFFSVIATGAGGSPAVQFVGMNNSFVADDLDGSTGNTDVGIDFTGSRGCKIIIGVDVLCNVQGTAGELRLAGNVLSSYAAIELINVIDPTYNVYDGPNPIRALQAEHVTNKEGSALSVGDIVHSNGTLGEVVLAQADTAANAEGPLLVMVTPPADDALGYAVPLTHGALVLVDGALPAPGDLLYLSEATAGRVTATVPPAAATNQKRRLGYAFHQANDGVDDYVTVVGIVENLPITSDGVAP